MKRRIDGRTIKGLRIREQVRERILIAYIALIRSGVPSPTARNRGESRSFAAGDLQALR